MRGIFNVGLHNYGSRPRKLHGDTILCHHDKDGDSYQQFLLDLNWGSATIGLVL